MLLHRFAVPETVPEVMQVIMNRIPDDSTSENLVFPIASSHQHGGHHMKKHQTACMMTSSKSEASSPVPFHLPDRETERGIVSKSPLNGNTTPY